MGNEASCLLTLEMLTSFLFWGATFDDGRPSLVGWLGDSLQERVATLHRRQPERYQIFDSRVGPNRNRLNGDRV